LGTLNLQKLSDDEICARYRAGESQGFIGLRARLSCYQVRDILKRHGVRLRTSSEALRLALRTRHKPRQKRETYKPVCDEVSR
jgi:hypothetical protein